MKITKSQLKQIIKEELYKLKEGGYAGHHLPGSVYDEEGEPEIASDYRDKPDPSRYGSGANPEEIEAWERRQAERDPDREYIEMIKKIMSDMGMRISAVPGDERQNRLLDQAIEELEMDQERPAGGGLGGPGGKARYPTRKEIEDARQYEPPPL